MEHQVRISSSGCEVEALVDMGTRKKGVVITHPHPLFGGDMYNPVVESIRRAYRGRGYTTLRFNFRGVGGSSGRFDNGTGELQDVYAALAWLAGLGIDTIALAGYSFGAWIIARSDRDLMPGGHLIMVAPPVAFLTFQPGRPISALKLVVTGSRDEIAPPASVKRQLPDWNPHAQLEIIKEADHFYSGHLNTLESVIRDHI